MSTQTETETAAATTKKRQRRLAEYYLQEQTPGKDWTLAHNDSFEDAAAAKRFVRNGEMEGTFRIVRVVDQFTAKKETKVVTKLS